MRILYGVHGYGRGHATRTLAILPELARRHQIAVLAGGDAYTSIWPDYPVVRIPTLGFAYGRRTGARSNFQTILRNAPAVLDLMVRGPVFNMVSDVVRDFAPDVVICDAEAWTHHVAAALKVPRISFDHIGIMRYCRPHVEFGDRFEASLDTFCYRLLTGRPDRVLVSSFYDAKPRHAGVQVVGTLPRQAVRETTPRAGEHLVAYFNQGQHQVNERVLTALEGVGCPVHIYGTALQGKRGRLSFLPPSNLPFIEDLASCRAVLSTAGNQLVGEAIYLGKPILVMPERCVEQRLNAAAVERLGIGVRVTPRTFTTARIRAFLDRLEYYQANLLRQVSDGLPGAVRAIEGYLNELAPAAAAEVSPPRTTSAVAH